MGKGGTDGDIDSKDGEENTRYKIVVNQYDPDTGERVDIEKTASKPKPDAAEKGAERAFTFRKFLNPLGDDVLKLGGSEVKIESEPLQTLLGKATFRYWKNHKVTEMTSPYHVLICCWDVANDIAKNPKPDESMEDAQARKDLEQLLQLISTSSGNESVDKYFKDRETLKKTQTITFDALWTLFPRGTEIVGRPFEGQEQLFFVSYCDAPLDLSPGEARERFNIYCYGYDWDGLVRRRVPYRVSIERFPDKKYIFELPYYPLQYHQDRQESGMEGKSNEDAIRRLRKKLEDRGRKFWDYSTRPQGKQMLSYDGIGYHQRGAGLFHAATPSGIADDSRSFFGGSSDDDARADAGSAKLYVKGTVVVDFKSFYAYQSTKQTLLGDMTTDNILDCDCGDCRLKYEELARFSWDRRKDTPTDEQFQFLPPRVLGYALEQKRWVQVGVKDLREPPEANQTNFESKLQLHDDYKKLIRRAVQAHSKNKTHNIVDYTPDKGKGLVILLWGLPGVGKTLTAESVALLAGKPLFSVGVSDIGLEGSKVEANLQKVFDLAGLWEAVLLFDEADVFLEARDTHKNDIQRNTIVSVLLRVLEYFSGILILTTNRLKSFDIAVQSRIHIAIEYTDLSEKQRENIFSEFLKQLHAKNLVSDINAVLQWVEEVGKEKDFNGRQIRNVVSTAMAIANADEMKLAPTHLNEVCKHVTQFKKALQEQETLFRAAQIENRKQGY
ncbi:ATPase family AAA domain-containing protein 3B [Madurella mycetomatis]|uniref:ATPase family AAA domain-containing protein 3B n=1 Tax=Madurella mycetomatis TaxID=100816 RepID=A0A175W8A6_9PEZI|nr:ATPase family AAA domain-containing protein 3B [Madurella mycetomatis]